MLVSYLHHWWSQGKGEGSFWWGRDYLLSPPTQIFQSTGYHVYNLQIPFPKLLPAKDWRLIIGSISQTAQRSVYLPVVYT